MSKGHGRTAHRTGATASARPHDKMLNGSLARGRPLITPRCQCSTGLGKHPDTCHHTDGGRVPEACVLAAGFWESKLTSRGLSPQTHVAVREDVCVRRIRGRTARNSKRRGRAFLPSNRDCSKCHRTRGKTDKINLFKTLEINQRPVTVQGGFFLEKRPNLGGKGKPCSIFSWLFPSPLSTSAVAFIEASSLRARAAVEIRSRQPLGGEDWVWLPQSPTLRPSSLLE